MMSLINLPEAATIALHCITIIACNDRKYSVNQLGDMTKFSKNHLAKVLSILAKNNYLNSDRGPNGGYSLNKEAKNTSLFEILEVIEGKVIPFQCTITCNKCYFKTCLFSEIPGKFDNDFINYLKNKKITDFKFKN